MNTAALQGFRLSPQQRHLWKQQHPPTASRLVHAELKVEGALDVRRLHEALERLVLRHEILRTAFRQLPGMGEPLQVILEQATLADAPVEVLSGPDAQQRLQAVEQELAQPCALTEAPLLRYRVLSLSPGLHLVRLVLPGLQADEATLRLLVQELAQAYGGAPEPEEPPLQYADVAEWQGELLESEEGAEGRAWWRKRLESAPPPPQPAFLQELPAKTDFQPASLPLALEPRAVAALHSTAQRLGASVEGVLLTCWQVLLARLSERYELTLAVASSGRRLEELAAALGPLSRYLPVPAVLEPRRTFQAAVAQACQALAEARQWEEYFPSAPWGAASPLCGFSYTELPPPLHAAGLSWELQALRLQGEPFALELVGTLAPGALGLELRHDAARLTPQVVELLAGRLRRLIDSACGEPLLPLQALELLPAEELHHLLTTLNTTAASLPSWPSLHAIFEQQAARYPERLAVASEGQALRYAELEARANQLAWHLRSLGVGPEACVGLCLGRSVDMVVALLGVMKAGGAYVPLDPSLPPERLRTLVEEVAAPAVVTTSALAAPFSSTSAQLVLLDSHAELLGGHRADRPPSGVVPGNLAYILFTSGSTGRPKGVAVEHAQLLNYVQSVIERLDLEGCTSFAMVSTFGADLGNTVLFPSLCLGAALHVLSQERAGSPAGVAEYLRQHPVDCMKIVPSHLTALMTAGEPREVLPRRRLVLGGEASSWELVERVRALVPECEVFNHYGPTETTVGVLTCKAELPPVRVASAPVPLGRPIANTQIYLLDSSLSPVPLGVPGEVYIGGHNVTRGYLGRPEQAAERFVPDPYGRHPGARLYRTGDRARYLADGRLQFLGRVDHQIKLRGFRVELGEIEAVLCTHPAVAQAVVVVRGASAEQQRLVAYVTGREGAGAVQVEALRQLARERLPEYMVPAVWVVLEALPLNANGKVDRKALPEPQGLESQREYVAPRTPAEELLAQVWAEVLRVPRVGALDHFFELGGHSLLATQVISRLRTAGGVELPLRELFAHPILEDLARRLEAASKSSASTPKLTPVERSGPLPLSFAQQRLWFLDQLQPGSAFYNIPVVLRLQGRLDRAVLESSLAELMRRHEVLRTTFRSEAGQPVQVIHPPGPVPLEVVDLAGLAAAEREAEALRLAAQEAQRSFHLERGPLLRALLLRLEEQAHVLVVNIHHIASDGWSMGVLVREMAALYEAFATGKQPQLPPLPVQYADYAVWQRNWLQGEVLEQQLGYWRQQLTGVAPLELPTDKPRPAVQSHRGALMRVHLPRELLEQVRAVCQQQGVTPFMLLLAAWQVLLHRYTGQQDIAVGSPIAGRRHAELEGLIGFFVNTLVLRGRVQGQGTFRELLAQVKECTLGAYAHQDVPFEKLVEELRPERDMSRSPLFQVLFALQNAPVQALELPGLKLGALEVESRASKFDVSLVLAERPEGLVGVVEYCTDLFERSTVERMIGHLRVLLEALLSRPEARVGTLPLLTEAERRQVLVEWNETRVDFPGEAVVHQLLAAQAARTPEAIAVSFESVQLTYRELDRRANQLAHLLRQHGIGPESKVAILLERSVDSTLAVVATLKAGGAFLTLEPAHPPERLAYTLADSGAALLLSSGALSRTVPQPGVPTLLVESLTPQLESLPSEPPTVSVEPQGLAYVIYTSGSTGRPKGTLLTHRGLGHIARAMAQAFLLQPGHRMLQFASPAFDASVIETFSALLSGATLVLAPRERLLPGAPLHALLQQAHVSAAFFTPSVLAALDSSGLPELAKIMACGEACTPEIARRWSQGRTLLNGYGPTEVTVCATVAPELSAEHVTIGRPMPGVDVYVLDGALQPVPPGVPGELYVGGPGLGRGYLGRPELTAERFLPHPFSSRPGERLYRTGDRVRWLANGELDFLGRADDQIKLRGLRIELGEVEAAVRELPSVQEAAVVLREDVRGDKRLVAYVVPREGSSLDAATLRQALRQKLPEYMVPSALVALPALPLTPNGKLDRKALPAPELPAGTYAPPSTQTEQELASLFAQVLRVERVGVEDDFFALGGHSLLATQLVSRVRSALGVELPLRTLFEAPTVRALAARLESQAAGAGPLPALVRAERSGPLPLSFAQQRLWFLDQLQPGSAFYNIPMVLRLQGRQDRAVLESSLTELMRRHEVLRTTFRSEAGQPVQVIEALAPLPLEAVDLGMLPAEERQAEALRLATQEARRPFHLERGPLLRVLLLRLEEQEHVLVVNIHHIASDGWSMGVLVREMAALYEAFATGKQPQLPPLPVQYADYAVWQRNWLQGEVLEQQLGYWRQQLSGVELLELPTDKPRPPVQSFRGANVPVHLPRELLEQVRAVCQQQGVTPFMLLLAAWQVLLHRYTGQQDIAVGSPIAGRRHAELEGLIGFFVNTLVLRGRVQGQGTFRELLAQVKECTLGAYAHQDVPFEKLVEELRPERDMSRTPLFQVLFALQNAPVQALELPGLKLGALEVESQTAKFDVSLVLAERPEGLVGVVEYCTDLFERSTVERMAGHLRVLLEALLSRPESHVGTLPLLTEAERRQVLVEWNETHADYPADTCLHTLVERQAALRPEAIAVESSGQRLTYAQLEQRANQLAHVLRRHGVGPDTPVALCLERSAELIVSLLAILKAGGAYVPLDVAYPPQRLSFMLEDAQPRLLLTTRALAERLPAASHLPCVCVEEVDFRGLPTSALASNTSARNLAYIIFTSGSTGRPKGVAVEHQAVLRLVLNSNYVRFTPEDCIAQVSNTSFDAATFEVWGALLHGARLALLPREVLLSPPHFVEALRRERVSSVFLTTALFNQVAQQVPGAFSSLREVLFGGEACDPNTIRSMLRQDPPARLLHVYGPTESTTFATWHPVLSVPEGATTVPIGGPLSNTTAYVLDAQLQPVPPGVPGELYLGGEGLARGYVGRPEATAERFVPHPFSTQPGERLYRTGDKVRWLPGGAIEFLGRFDSQVKLRGFRIELGEVEAALRELPGVREAFVLLREDTPGDKRLVAYVTSRGPQPLEASALREALRQRLPEYMVPSALMVLEALPLNANGKVDRKALPSPDSTPASSQPFVAPRDALEQELATLWAELLGVQRVGIHDDFFELGGHSLLAVRLAARLQRTLGRELALSTLFQHPTVARLAEVLRSQQGQAQPGSTLLRLQAGEAATRPLFLVHGGGGSALAYLELVRHLRPSQPLYAFHAPGVDGGEVQPASVEELARQYLARLREVQPVGPYLLGGWSFGGVVAFEVARQLQAASEAVELLALIDSPAPAGPPKEQDEQGEQGELGLLAGLGRLVGVSWEQLELDGEHLRRLGGRERLAWLLEQVRRSPAGAPDITLEQLERMLLILEHHRQALWQYTPGPYEGSAVFFKAQTPLGPHTLEAPQQWSGWLKRGLTVHELPGDHYSLLREPHVATLGQWLNRLLGAPEQGKRAV